MHKSTFFSEMLEPNLNASDLTKRQQSRVIYANYIVNKQKFEGGCAGRIDLTTGSAADNAASAVIALLEGARNTTAAERDAILDANECPVVAAPAPAPAPAPPADLKLLVLGDTAHAAVATSISNRLTALGYTSATVSSAQLGTTYTGSTITTATYNVVLMFTNAGQIGAAALSSNLANFVAAGGHFVSATFIWSLYPSGFNAALTPFQLNAQSNDSTGNMTVNIVHPITTGVTTSLTNGALILNNGNAALQTGATKIASYTTSGAPLVAIQTSGSSRLVGLNIGLYTATPYTNLINLVVNACLWANSII